MEYWTIVCKPEPSKCWTQWFGPNGGETPWWGCKEESAKALANELNGEQHRVWMEGMKMWATMEFRPARVEVIE